MNGYEGTGHGSLYRMTYRDHGLVLFVCDQKRRAHLSSPFIVLITLCLFRDAFAAFGICSV